MTRCGWSSPTKSARTIAASGIRRPPRSSTRIASAAIWAESRKPTKRWPAGLACSPKARLAMRPATSEVRPRFSEMKARVFVMPKEGVLDPQGKAIGHALGTLGFKGIGEVRQGKVIELEFAETDQAKARAQLDEMCKKLLANTVIESYRVEIVG